MECMNLQQNMRLYVQVERNGPVLWVDESTGNQLTVYV